MAGEKVHKDDEEELFLVDDEDESFQENKYLLFNNGDEIYGINIMIVTDIIELQKITAVPDMPDFIKGVINLRGKVIPVMDLRLRFGMAAREYDDRTCIIIVNVERSSIGIIVDTVAEVKDILEKDIDPPPSFKKDNTRDRYISGLGKVDDEVKILLDVKKILDQDTVHELDKLAKEA